MIIGVCTIEMHLPASRSLKEKRHTVKRLKDRVRARYNVSVAELSHHADLWQRAAVAVVSIASDRDVLARLFESILREAEMLVPGQILDAGTEFIEGVDGGPNGWSDDWS